MSETHKFYSDVYSTLQNYLVWRLVIDRVSNLSRRFKDARANYRKVLNCSRFSFVFYLVYWLFVYQYGTEGHISYSSHLVFFYSCYN